MPRETVRQTSALAGEMARGLGIAQALIELLDEKRELFFEVKAIKEIGLANVIREGRQDEFVSKDQILAVLRGQA